MNLTFCYFNLLYYETSIYYIINLNNLFFPFQPPEGSPTEPEKTFTTEQKSKEEYNWDIIPKREKSTEIVTENKKIVTNMFEIKFDIRKTVYRYYIQIMSDIKLGKDEQRKCFNTWKKFYFPEINKILFDGRDNIYSPVRLILIKVSNIK